MSLCYPGLFPLWKRYSSTSKGRDKGNQKVGDTTLLWYEQRQSRLGMCGLEGREAEGRCREPKITDVDGKVNYGIVIQCFIRRTKATEGI